MAARQSGVLRHPRTTQERRAGLALLADEDGQAHGLRPRRVGRSTHSGEHQLPDIYDDIFRSSYENRNWKRFRKNRWKG